MILLRLATMFPFVSLAVMLFSLRTCELQKDCVVVCRSVRFSVLFCVETPFRGDYLFGGPELSNVISKPGFYISRFVKTALKQHSNSRLSRRSPQRGEERVPLGRDLRVGRQTVQVDQALGFCDGLLVERRNPRSKCVNKRVEFGVR